MPQAERDLASQVNKQGETPMERLSALGAGQQAAGTICENEKKRKKRQRGPWQNRGWGSRHSTKKKGIAPDWNRLAEKNPAHGAGVPIRLATARPRLLKPQSQCWMCANEFPSQLAFSAEKCFTLTGHTDAPLRKTRDCDSTGGSVGL